MANMLGRGAQMRSPRNLIFEEIVPSSGWTEDSDCCCLIIDLPGFKTDEVKLQVDNYGHLVVSGERQVNEMKHVRFEQSYKVPDNSNIEDTSAKFEDDILYIIIPKKATEEIIKDDDDQGKNNNAQAYHQQQHLHEEESKQNDAFHKDDKLLDEAKNGSNDVTEDQRMKEETTKEEEEEKEEEEVEEFHDARKDNQWNIEDSLMGTLRVQLMKNKGIFVTAILAFSLGVLVSQKFQTNHES